MIMLEKTDWSMHMKIGIIGATGMAGSAFVIEGYQRRHQVTAITRSAGKVTRMFGN